MTSTCLSNVTVAMVTVSLFADTNLLPTRQAHQTDFRIGTPPAPRLYPYQPADYYGPIEQPIRISAARREFESFMVYVISGDKPVSQLEVKGFQTGTSRGKKQHWA